MNSFDPAKPVQTRDGRKARIITTDARVGDDTIVALISNDRGDGEEVYTYNRAGAYYPGHVFPLDLINVPERETRKYAIGRIGSSYEDRFGIATQSPSTGVDINDEDAPEEIWSTKALAITFEDGQPVAVELVTK